jgi:hypothetical protein
MARGSSFLTKTLWLGGSRDKEENTTTIGTMCARKIPEKQAYLYR